MAEVYPFIGTRYNSQMIGNLNKVICPPCDAISSEQQAELYERHANNVVRLESGVSDAEDDNFSNRFTRAANTLGTWRSDGVFIEDEKPSFYFYEQVYQDADGNEIRRAGFYAKVKLDEECCVDIDAADDISGARAHHLKMLRATKANITAVSSVFQDDDSEILDVLQSRMAEKPWEEMVDEAGVTHRLWVVQKKDILLKLVDVMKSRQVFIADGQQRYLTAQIYRDEMRAETGKADAKQPYDFIMMLLIPAQQDGIMFSATHRALTRSIMADVDLKDALEEIGEYFEIKKEKCDLQGGAKEARRIQGRLDSFAAQGADSDAGDSSRTAIGLVHSTGNIFYLIMKDDVQVEDLYDNGDLPDCVGTLDVCILHNFIINQVLVGNPEYELEDDECLFTHSAEGLLDLLKNRKAVCGFLMNSVSMPQMLEIAQMGKFVPMELGVLSPRPATGLVMRNMQTDARKAPRR